VREDVAGAQQVEDLGHELRRRHAADVAHDLRAAARDLAGADRALERLDAACAITFSEVRTFTPSAMSAFSPTVRPAASACAKPRW
jgi:hypothetical protein